MILMIGEDTTRVGIRVKCWRNQRYVRDWENVYLIIRPGQLDPGANCCHVPGSPWIVYGCWPLHRTGVDLMNPPKPDFPPFFIKASEMVDGEVVVFDLPEHWRQVARFGRHTGIVRYQPMRNIEWPVLSNGMPGFRPYPEPVPPCDCCDRPGPPPPSPLPPRLPACDLAAFDIDYGPRCTLNHIIDRVDVEVEE